MYILFRFVSAATSPSITKSLPLVLPTFRSASKSVHDLSHTLTFLLSIFFLPIPPVTSLPLSKNPVTHSLPSYPFRIIFCTSAFPLLPSLTPNLNFSSSRSPSSSLKFFRSHSLEFTFCSSIPLISSLSRFHILSLALPCRLVPRLLHSCIPASLSTF